MGIGVKVAQVCLATFNFIFVLFGLAGIITGAILRVKYDDYINLTSKNVGSVSILLIILGGVIFVLAFFGCCGAIKKNSVMLTIYIIFLTLVLLIEIGGAIAAYIYKDKLKDYVEDGMENAIDKYYNETKYQKAIDDVQNEFHCCGAKSESDWKNSTIPKSCCKSNCSSTTGAGRVNYKEGCADKLFDYLRDHLAITGGLVLGIAIIQIIGIIFACVVRRDVKEGYNYV